MKVQCLVLVICYASAGSIVCCYTAFARQNLRRCSALITVECLAYFFAYGISRSLRLRGRASLLRIEINGIVNAVNYN